MIIRADTFSSASGPGFLSGWYLRASLRYAFFSSALVALGLTPRMSEELGGGGGRGGVKGREGKGRRGGKG